MFNNALYFSAFEGTFGQEIRRYDGTTVTRITDINPNTGNSDPSNLTVFGNALYFSANEPTFGRELWRYDGSTVSRLSDINLNAGSSSPADLFAFGGFLYFSADGGAGNFGRELYRYNGSTVSRVTDINPNAGSSSPTNLTAFGGSLYFTATDPTFGNELYRYTNPVLTRVTDINPNAGSSSPLFLTPFGNALYFSAQDSGAANTFGRELWRWDGTTATRITDINTGTLSSSPSNFVIFDGALYFAATDQNTVGNELWRYDGTTVTLAADINPGFPFSSPTSPIVFDGSLFVRATGATQGDELWRYTLRRQTGAYTVFLPAGQGAAGRDFGDLRVVNAGADQATTEATAVNLSATISDPFPATPGGFSFLWQVAADNGQLISSGATQNFSFTPNDNGRYTVTLTVTDANDGNRQYQETVVVFVSNVAPTIEAGANITLNEGQTLTRALTFTDPGADVWNGTIDYGDGSAIIALTIVELADKAFTLSHLYTDSGLFTVVVRVNDDDGGTVSDTFQVTSNNLPPIADAGADQVVAEGTPVTLAATVSDPGTSDTFFYAWSVTASNGQVIPNGTEQNFSFTPADNGTYTVSLTVTDDDGASATDGAVITATNVAPAITLSGAATVAEGSFYTLTLGTVLDPGADTITQYRVNWGDGSEIELLTAAQVDSLDRALTHRYLDGTVARTITVDLVDEDGIYAASATLGLTVQNIAPALTGLSRSNTTLSEGGTLTLGGTFSDPGSLDGFTILINWGDGSVVENIVRPAGSTDFSAVHQYLDDAPSGTASDAYVISVTINDGSASSAPSITGIVIENADPLFSSFGISAATVTEGANITVDGSVSDAGILDTHVVTVNWGDGSAIQTLTFSPDKSFNASHLYDVPGSYSVTTKAIDDDGGMVIDTRLVIIVDLPPVIAASNLGTATEGALFTSTGSFTDLSGPEDSWSATVQYDNGTVLPLLLNVDKTFILQTVFAHDSPHSVTITITDSFGQRDIESFAIEVQNVAPVIQPVANLTLKLGQDLSQQITFSDPGSDTWTAAVDFGDGSALVNIPSTELTDRAFTLTHSYASAGVKAVTVNVNDGEATGSANFTVTLTENHAPIIDPVADQTIGEGQLLSVPLSAHDTDLPAQILVFSLTGSVPAGAAVNPTTGVFTWTPSESQGPGVYNLIVRVSDGTLFSDQPVHISVTEVNVAPIIGTIDPRTVDEEAPLQFLVPASDADLPVQALQYTLSNSPTGMTVSNAGLISWTPNTSQGRAAPYIVTVNVSDGTVTASRDFSVTVSDPLLKVSAFEPAPSGFTIRFNRPVEQSVLSLYATEAGGQGPADVTLVGTVSGSIRGSLVVGDNGQSLGFIKSGGVLDADSYTVTLRSALNGLIDHNGLLLDGNGDGTMGDDYLGLFTVAPSSTVVISLPDFARGAGQNVDVPATASGIPITLSNGAGIESVDLTIRYNPALLTITSVLAGSALPIGSAIEANLTIPGEVRIALITPTPLTAGVAELVKLIAQVPQSAPYRATEILDITSAVLNEGSIPVRLDDALHVAAYFGDATGTGTYSSLDAQRVLRVVVGLDTGFANFIKVDPLIIGDITGNGIMNSLDATRILQEVVGLDRPEIPPLPGIIVPAPIADPLVNMPTDLSGTPGSTVTVPINIDNADLLESVELKIGYDTTVFDVAPSGVRTGALTAGATLLANVNAQAGTINVSLLNPKPLTAGSGSILEIDFQVGAQANTGPVLIDLQSLSLNEGQLVLTIEPTVGSDGTDGRVNINAVNPTVLAKTTLNQPGGSDTRHVSEVEFDKYTSHAIRQRLTTDFDFPERDFNDGDDNARDAWFTRREGRKRLSGHWSLVGSPGSARV